MITHAEIVELFGERVPIEAANLIHHPPPYMSLADLRATLRQIAAAARDEPTTKETEQ